MVGNDGGAGEDDDRTRAVSGNIKHSPQSAYSALFSPVKRLPTATANQRRNRGWKHGGLTPDCST